MAGAKTERTRVCFEFSVVCGTKLFALSQQFWSLDKVMTLCAFMSGNVQMVSGFCSILNIPDLIDKRKSQTSYYAVSGDQFSAIQSKLNSMWDHLL